MQDLQPIYSLAKLLSPVSNYVLRRNTEQCSAEFLKTDSMKHIVSETKKNFKDNQFVAQSTMLHALIACISTMCCMNHICPAHFPLDCLRMLQHTCSFMALCSHK